MRCGGSRIVFVVASMSHPRITLDVVHVVSPCFIFYRRRFLSKGCIGIVEWAKHSIEGAEKDLFDPSAGPLVALHETAKIVHVNIPIP